MKRILVVFLIVITLAIALISIFSEQIMIVAAKSAIVKALPGSRVVVGGCSIRPASSISFSGIKISRAGLVDISIQNFGVQYEPGSLLKGRVRRVYIKGASINVDSTSKKLVSLFPRTEPGSIRPGVFIENIELSGIKFNVSINGSSATGSLEMAFKNMELLPEKIGLIVDSAKFGPANLKGLSFGASRGIGDGVFGITSIKVNDISVSEISGQPLLSDRGLVVDKLTARVFNGKAEGIFRLALDKEAHYSLDLKLSGIDTHEAVLAFKLGERVDSTGSVKGELKVEGKGAVLTVVKGVFSVDENGGLFVIKDEEFLKMIAERTKQPIEIIKESFRDYRYNKGTAWLNLEEKDIHSGIALEGEKGKRNVDLVFHDIIK